jgi:hypothetical protein
MEQYANNLEVSFIYSFIYLVNLIVSFFIGSC